MQLAVSPISTIRLIWLPKADQVDSTPDIDSKEALLFTQMPGCPIT